MMSKIYITKLILGVFATFFVIIGLINEGNNDILTYMIAIVMIPFSTMIWTKTLYDKMQEERSFKISFVVFDILTLLMTIALFAGALGMYIRTLGF